MRLQYTRSGHVFISANDDCNEVVDTMLVTGYDQDFCIADDFDPEFTARLMEAGFLVMSANIAGENEKPYYILLPKLHLKRSALFYENLHIKKSIKKYINRYELCPDADFDRIIDRCVEKHGADWLTPPLVNNIKKIRTNAKRKMLSLLPAPYAYPASFALYRSDKLAAGEFGVVCGNIYTSYSGFYEEDNAGTVQLILAAQYLKENGFLYFDLGMPMDYKTGLGAVDITDREFIGLFRNEKY